MKHPLVSIIIPCFNAERFIEETLESLQNQSYKNIEVIAVDDGSTDRTWDYLQQTTVLNLSAFKNRRQGACAARNYGFELSSGDFIQFMDADDLISPLKIEKQVQLLMNNPDAVAVCSTSHFFENKEKGTITDRKFLYTTNKPKEFLLNLYGGNGENFEMVQTSAWLSPRSCIQKAGLWDERLSKDQDGEFFCRVVAHSSGVCYEPHVLNYYRKHRSAANISNKKERRHIESQLLALKSKEQQLNSEAETQAYKNAMAIQYRFLAINAYPAHTDLCNHALKKSEFYGGSDYTPVLGGRSIELVKRYLGWKCAKQLKETFKKIQDRSE